MTAPTSRLSLGLSDSARQLRDQLHAAGIGLPNRETLAQYRQSSIEANQASVETAINHFSGEIETAEINGVSCRCVTPTGWNAIKDPCIQYAFGGGYVSGSTFEDQVITLPIATEANARVVMVDYCLSPEYPYPLPQQDMDAVYPALVDQYGAARLAICGESAGGHQALGLLQRIRQQGLPLPSCAALLSPWCDLTNQGDSHEFNQGRDPSLNNEWVNIASQLHANGQPLNDLGISPLFAEMRDLPPTLITSGSCDLLLSQCLRLAQRMRAAEVECDLRVWEGLWHVFEFYPIPEAQQSLTEIAVFIRQHASGH